MAASLAAQHSSIRESDFFATPGLGWADENVRITGLTSIRHSQLVCIESQSRLTLSLAGGSDAGAAGEGFFALQESTPPANPIALSGPESPTLPEGE